MTIRSRPTTDEYRDNFDRIFRKKSAEESLRNKPWKEVVEEIAAKVYNDAFNSRDRDAA